MYIEKYDRPLMFYLYLETYGMHNFLNQFVIFNKNDLLFNKNFSVPLDFYQGKFDSPHLHILF